MPNTTLNMIKDLAGVLKAIFYRTLWEHSWSAPQPMFNIVDVAEGMEDTFESFLAGGLSKGKENNTFFSFGPYRVANSSTYIYVTHYGSTGYFVRMIAAMAGGGILSKRAKATQSAVWAYYHAGNVGELDDMQLVTVVAVAGDATDLLNFFKEKNIQMSTLFFKAIDVRGRSAGTYFAISDSIDTTAIQKEFSGKNGKLHFYNVKKITLKTPNTESMS